MPPLINNALVPQIVYGPGLQIQVYQGTVLINGGIVQYPTTVVGLLANVTTYIFLNISSGVLQTNNSGFPANSYPIAITTTANDKVVTLSDQRPDYVITGANTGINGRFILNFGTSLSAGNFSLINWGTGASVTGVSGKDSAHSFTITAGSTPGVAPSVTLTFADGAWNQAPLVFVSQSKGSGSIFPVTYSSNTTGYTLTFNGLPISGNTYVVSVLVCGLS